MDRGVACLLAQNYCSTLLVTGKHSHIVKWLKDVPGQLAERKAAFRDLTEVELDDCGHMMHHDQPGRLAGVIEKFVTETP